MDARAFDRWASSQQAIPKKDVRTFTPTEWVGFSVDPVGDVEYVDTGALVMMWPGNAQQSFDGTSDGTAMVLRGLPESIRPTTGTQIITFGRVHDNASNGSVGMAVIDAIGDITFGIPVLDTVTNRLDYSITGFEATGGKGWDGVLMYAKR